MTAVVTRGVPLRGGGHSLNLRMWSPQLHNYLAVVGETTSVVPDLATAMPKITDGGLHYSVTIRKGAKQPFSRLPIPMSPSPTVPKSTTVSI